MNISRSAFSKQRSQRYNYKTQNTFSTNRSSSSYQAELQASSKKHSTSKHKKVNLQNSIKEEDYEQLDSFRVPFKDYTSDLNIDSSKVFSNNTELQKKQSSHLKRKNKQLQARMKDHQKEIKQLRQELKNVLTSRGRKQSKPNTEAQRLRQVNTILQSKYNAQSIEIHGLRNELAILRSTLDNSKVSEYTPSRIEDSNVSRRAIYAQQYQNATKPVSNKNNQYSNQSQHYQEMQSMKQKYSKELCKLQAQVSSFKEKELLMEVLEQQIKNKNDCIDYLRKQLQNFEINSKKLLETINWLQQRVQESVDNKNKYEHSQQSEQQRYSFRTFNNNSKY